MPSARHALAGALSADEAEPKASISLEKRFGPISGKRCMRKRASSSAGEEGAFSNNGMRSSLIHRASRMMHKPVDNSVDNNLISVWFVTQIRVRSETCVYGLRTLSMMAKDRLACRTKA